MTNQRKATLLYALLVCFLGEHLFVDVRAEDGGGGYYDDDQAYADDDAAAAYDDAYAYGGNDDGNDGNYDDAANDDATQYWTDYSVRPKRCFVYNNVDVVMFSSYQYGYNQCIGSPLGTYVVPVSSFVDAYLGQAYADALDSGSEYELPGAAQYLQCTQMQVGDDMYWAQIGCSEMSSKALALKLYSDDTCSTRVSVDGWDGSDVDMSGIVIPFKQCQTCVTWVNHNDDAVDDQYYKNKQTSSPLCSALWENQQECDRTCQKMGHGKVSSSGWNTSDKVLLSILSVFGVGMLIAILRKRRNMSKKEVLLEEAAMSAWGLQLTHIIGIFILVVIVIVVFALLGLKKITWGLLILLTTILFSYLMKLTVESGMAPQNCTDVCCPDATALPDADYITSRTELPVRGVV
uniref:Uncharacterized protein n=1 Tax=Odontella aurita TaxID=265563 RepID=A0A7S4N8T7_9STRA|mmetsp:Transcript_53504/g.160112  ORF Transcript_53504/g.160112 Transcript_53504/m.160112 type:complete len:405 (+) Transcript_53504:140-1354(+)